MRSGISREIIKTIEHIWINRTRSKILLSFERLTRIVRLWKLFHEAVEVDVPHRHYDSSSNHSRRYMCIADARCRFNDFVAASIIRIATWHVFPYVKYRTFWKRSIERK